MWILCDRRNYLSLCSNLEGYLRILIKVLTFFRIRYDFLNKKGDIYEKNQNIYHRILYWRERFMSENVQWVADFFGDDSKITIWAHNGHVANDSIFYGDGSMGYYLREALGDLYQVLGFGFSQGYFTALGRASRSGMWTHLINTEPEPDSINFLFHHASQKNFVFNPDSIPPGSEWDNWLSQPRPFLYIGALYNGNPSDYYKIQDVREFYNRIIYIDKTTNSRLISLQ